MRTAALLALLLAVASAAASLSITVVSHDIDVQSTYSNLKACSCGVATDTFTVKNLGDLESGFGFSVDGDQPWFTLDKSTAYLAPGASTSLTVFTSAPCGAVGTAHYTVYVSSEYGRYRAIDKSIEVGVCEDIKALVTPQASVIQPCGTQTFRLNLTNVATFQERYSIDGALGFQSATLDPGESTTLYGGYTAGCSEWGSKQIPVTVKAQSSGLTDTQYVSITVPRAYDYSLSIADVSAPVCKGVTNVIPVEIANTEDRDNTVSVSGTPWTSSTSVYVPANRTRVALLDFTPQKAGNTVVTVTATGANGSVQKQASTNLSVQTCYGFTAEAPKLVQSCAGPLFLPFTIQSQGDQTQQLSFDVQSNTTTSVDSLNASLSPGQQFDKQVEVHVPDADSSYYVTLVANSTYAGAKATTTVQAHSTQTCYAVEPEASRFRVWTDQAVLPVVVKQTGVQTATYSVRYNGSFLQPIEHNLTLSPGGEAVLHLAVNSTGYRPGRYIDRLVLSTNGVDYATDFSITLSQKGFFEQFLDACRWNGGFAVCSGASTLSLVLLLLVVLASLGILVGFVRYENPEWYSKETAAIIAGAVLVVLLILMIVTAPVVPRSYSRPVMPANESGLHYELGAGQVLSINVSRFFYSPESSPLTFTANQPEHLQIRMQDGIALIRPDVGYSGEQTVVFTANDSRGGITDSDLFTIDVVPFKPVTFLEYWQYACWFLTFLFLFLGVAIALLTTLFIKDIKPLAVYKRQLVLYRRPKLHVISGSAHELVEQADTRIQQLAPGAPVTQVGQVIGTQIIGEQKEQLFVASAEGTKFHRITCPVVKGMPKDKRLTFTSKEDAIKAGYTPCKTCSSHD